MAYLARIEMIMVIASVQIHLRHSLSALRAGATTLPLKSSHDTKRLQGQKQITCVALQVWELAVLVPLRGPAEAERELERQCQHQVGRAVLR